MRDAAIIEMDRRNTKRDGLILAQFEFLKTRQEAAELLLQSSGWRDRLRWALWPAGFLTSLDRVQGALLEESKAALAAASAKSKIQVVPAAHVSVRGG